MVITGNNKNNITIKSDSVSILCRASTAEIEVI